jgi:type II secretory pathway pseudopilin PulG
VIRNLKQGVPEEACAFAARLLVQPPGRSVARSAGFTYVWLLVAVAVMATGLAAIGEVASTAAKREKEAELLFVGDQFARAIAEYHASSPGAPQYPQKLEDLLVDNRYPNARRYLRRVYPDPMTGRADWGLLRGPGGGIVGVHSQSLERPLKIANFPRGYESLNGATTYAAWRFTPQAGGGPATREKSTTPAAPAGKSGPSTTATARNPSAPAMPSSR